jgi:outer membrane protein OmpA-like peptidoglycan-associated protein
MNQRILICALVASALAACSSTRTPNAGLDQARSSYAAAQNDPQVNAFAADELRLAAASLRTADQAFADGEPTPRVDHLAYMTSQRVVIARETTSSRADQAVTAGAAAERDRLRLAVRTSEANAAQQQLAISQQSNADKAAALAQAEADAKNAQERSQERIARRDARLADMQMQLQLLNARKTERGMVVTLGDVLFDNNQSQLTAASSNNLAKLADFFRRNPDRSALIEGYTDSVGSAESNQSLSDRRANAVKAALVQMGVAPGMLTASGHGETMPTADNATAAGRQMNRRVEIVFTNQPDELAVK